MKHSASVCRRADARAGFSMIEMLAALAIAGAMVAVIAEFAGRTMHNWNRGEQTIAVMEMMTRGIGRLSTDLSLALPMGPPGGDGASVFFLGNTGHLQFVAATGFGSGNRGVELLDIATSEDRGDTLLVRRRGLVTNPPSQFHDPVTLLRGRMQVRLHYRTSDGKLTDTWERKSELPTAVVVEILNSEGAQMFAAPFVLPVATNFPADCLSEPEEGQEQPARCAAAGAKAPAPAPDAEPKTSP